MRFLDAEFVQGFIRMADDGWQQGWHERNGGNLSYRVKPGEMAADRYRRAKACGRIFPGDRERKIFPECVNQTGGFHLYDRVG